MRAATSKKKKRQGAANSSKNKIATKPKKVKQPSKSKPKSATMKLSDKLKTLTASVTSMKKSLSKLQASVIDIESRDTGQINEIAQLVRDLLIEINGFKYDNELRKAEIERCAKNIAQLFEAKNASERHEKHSGTRASPAGRIADEGLIGMPLPGSFESNKR